MDFIPELDRSTQVSYPQLVELDVNLSGEVKEEANDVDVHRSPSGDVSRDVVRCEKVVESEECLAKMPSHTPIDLQVNGLDERSNPRHRLSGQLHLIHNVPDKANSMLATTL